jgi:hypothetical protein
LKLAEPQPGSGTAAPKSFWSTVLTATPILLTVLATLLAGLSSRELTLSQYHRALAAQNQSKAGDQWNFFQAKRSRRTNHENTADLLQARAESSKIEAATVEANLEFFLERLRRAEKDVSDLLQRIGTAKEELAAVGGAALHEAAVRLQQTVREKTKQVELARPRIQDLFSRSEVRAAWPYLNSNERPHFDIQPTADTLIQKARQAIEAGRSEKETFPLVRRLPDDMLEKDLANAETNVQGVERAYEPISEALGQIEKAVQEQISLARSFQEAIRHLEAAAIDLPGGTDGPLADIRASIAALSRSRQAVKSAADELNTGFKTAWHAYQARRYKDEAEFNRQAAEMYEVYVRKSSAISERHRDRSKNFFYGMLAAQAGVTIATFSLAVKHKSILWGLATLAGIGAILFGLYVHVYI